MTIPQEHQSLSFEFGPINNGTTTTGRGGRTKNHSHSVVTTVRVPRATVAMPTVTLPTHRNSRHATHSPHRTNLCSSSSGGSYCSMARLSQWTFLGLFIFYANELSSSLTFFHPTVRSTPHVRGDYSSIRGVHDLQSSHVRPKCFSGASDCPCSDPLVAQEGGSPIWMETHALNQLLAENADELLDVVFLGDSITERWRETEYGEPSLSALGSTEIFDSFFSKENGGVYSGLALGISGDTSPMLLWRLQNGEIPASLNPSVFWLLVGTNDIGRSWCSAEMVLLGVIRNVEEILRQKPMARVVINGLLPFTFNRDGYVGKGGAIKPSVWADIQTINSELKMYATYRGGERVTFFETDVFLKDPKLPVTQIQIDKELMPDYLHPSPAGYSAWGKEIIKVLDALLMNEQDAEADDVV